MKNFKITQQAIGWVAIALIFMSTALSPLGKGVFISDKGNEREPEDCAVLEIESTQRGFLPPRMTTVEREAIAKPVADGLQIYNTDKKNIEYWNETINSQYQY